MLKSKDMKFKTKRICRFCNKRFRVRSGVQLTCSTCLSTRNKCKCGCGGYVSKIGAGGHAPISFIHGHNSRGVKRPGAGYRYWASLSEEQKEKRASKISNSQ